MRRDATLSTLSTSTADAASLTQKCNLRWALEAMPAVLPPPSAPAAPARRRRSCRRPHCGAGGSSGGAATLRRGVRGPATSSTATARRLVCFLRRRTHSTRPAVVAAFVRTYAAASSAACGMPGLQSLCPAAGTGAPPGPLPSGVLARGGWARRAAPSWPCKLQKGPVTRCPPPKQSLAATWPWRGPAAHRWRHRKRSSQGPRRRAARGNGEGGRERREGVSIHAKFDVHRTQAPREAAPRRVEAVPEFSRIFSELLQAPRPLHRGGEAGTQKSERSPPAAHTRITDRPTRRLRPPRSGS